MCDVEVQHLLNLKLPLFYVPIQASIILDLRPSHLLTYLVSLVLASERFAAGFKTLLYW